MIPTTDLLRLLNAIIDADGLRAHPGDLTRDGFGTFCPDLDPQSFATLARIAAGEAWEGEFAPGHVPIPVDLLRPADLWRLYDLATSSEQIGNDAAEKIRRLATYSRSTPAT